MPALKFPATIFQTKHKFNDYNADDMKCGDLTEKQLRRDLVQPPDAGNEVRLRDPQKREGGQGWRALDHLNQLIAGTDSR
ncbi:DUF3289 family protein, partial [Pantoea agglomerans]|uniref:DUF3289 family protein n=1 Tax=Enterobacter agglomerans TaxID=549 RepID=UPI001A8E05F0|nr:DUF3289 family protein [Pantoea agglomerans]